RYFRFSSWSAAKSSTDSFTRLPLVACPSILLTVVVCWSVLCASAAAQTRCVSFSDSIDGVDNDHTVESRSSPWTRKSRMFSLEALAAQQRTFLTPGLRKQQRPVDSGLG